MVAFLIGLMIGGAFGFVGYYALEQFFEQVRKDRLYARQ